MSCPASLLEIQRWVGRIVSRPLREMGAYNLPDFDEETAREIESMISSGPHLTPQQRIGLYNQQYWFRLFTIMQEQYPTVTRLFGFASYNREILEPYFFRFPPDHWAISRLGGRLPEWLEKEYDQPDKILVYETALVDAAYEALFFAKSERPLALQDFARAKVEPIFLQPFVQLVPLHADLFSFRAKLLEHEPEYWVTADFPKIEWGEERFYTLSKEFGAEEITANEIHLLKAFRKGATLRNACKGVSLDAEPLIASWFKEWTQRGWLTVH